MDKKNTMLLTVIAVATLLVAVVGATFAFFTAQNSAEGTTTVSATTELVGAVTVNNPTNEMHLYLASVNMAQQDDMMKPYYATTTSADFVADWEMKPISQITVTGGESTTSYSCYYTLDVTGTDVLEAGDASVKFELPTVNQVTNLEIVTGATNGVGGTAIDVANEVDLESNKTYTVRFDVTGNIETATTIINAGFELNNLTTEQDHLKGKDLTFTAAISGMKCTVK